MTIQELFEIKIYHGYILQLFLAEALFFRCSRGAKNLFCASAFRLRFSPFFRL